VSVDVGIMKNKIMEAIESKVPVFKRSSATQTRIRRPFCGDSQTNMTDAHLYLKCSPDPTEPILYKCFKCSASGKVSENFLKKLDIQIDGLIGLAGKQFNRLTSIRQAELELMTGSVDMQSDQVGYTEYRLGPGLGPADYDRFKIVWDMKAIIPFVSNSKVRNSLPSNSDSISFISDDKSMLLTRFFNPGNGLRWKKTKLFQNGARSFYTIKATLDRFSSEPITVNVVEGIYDAIGIYKNFPTGPNSAYLAFLGTDYEIAVDYVMVKGLVGGNIRLRVYADGDVDLKRLRFRLRRYQWMFQSITIIKNTKGKDFGLPLDQIVPIEIKL
jgi:hypothetical protein